MVLEKIFGNLFCKLGIHWLKEYGECSLFWDKVSGNPVFAATCCCDKEWMVETCSKFPIAFSKFERD